MKNREKEILRLLEFSGSNFKEELNFKEEHRISMVENEKQREGNSQIIQNFQI